MSSPRITLAGLLALHLVGCSSDPPPPAPDRTGPGAASTAPPATGVAVVKMPDGTADGAAWVRAQHAEALRAGRRPLVYVGAAWCEPCVRFKDAAGRGELDAELPGLVLLELDRDRDEATLQAMGCLTRMIPLVAVADADGRCTDRRFEGAIKGEGAVGFMTPRVKALLASP